MYTLKVIKNLKLENGTLYMVGHDCKGLTAFEVAALATDHPKHFEPADDLTRDFLESDPDNVKKLAAAAKTIGKE